MSTTPGQPDSKTKPGALVAVFEDRELAHRAVRDLEQHGVEWREMHSDGDSDPKLAEFEQKLKELYFPRADDVETGDVLEGITKGALWGAAAGASAAGALFLVLPPLGLLAPVGGAIGGMLSGALIGGMAGIDESVRDVSLPRVEDYKQAMIEGKTLVVIPGDEPARVALQNQMRAAGAEATWQHPPVAHAVHSLKPETPEEDSSKSSPKPPHGVEKNSQFQT